MKKWTIAKDFEYLGIENVKRIANKEPSKIREPIIGLWITGCRASEYVALHTGMFQWLEDGYGREYLNVTRAPLRKQRKKVLMYKDGEPWFNDKGQRIFKLMPDRNATRNFAIFRDDPFIKEFTNILDELGEDERLFPFNRKTLWKYTMLANIRPHQLRAERAMYFVTKKNMGIPFLKKWFGWSTSMMPEWYINLTSVDLVNMMYRGVL